MYKSSRVLFSHCTIPPTPRNTGNGLYHMYCQSLKARGFESAEEAPEPERLSTSADIARLFGHRCRHLVTGGAPTAPAVLAWARKLVPGASFSDSYG